MLFGLFAFHGESFGRADNDISFTSRFVMQGEFFEERLTRQTFRSCR